MFGGMQTIDTILSRIEAHCSAHGIAESTFGRLTVNDGKFVPRLRAGGSMTLRTLDRIEAVLAGASMPPTLPATPPEPSETCSESSGYRSEAS